MAKWVLEAAIQSMLGRRTQHSHSGNSHSIPGHHGAPQLLHSLPDIRSSHSECIATYPGVRIKGQTEALRVFIIYLIVGHQRSTTHFFFLEHIRFWFKQLQRMQEFLKNSLFYVLQSTVYCISLISHINDNTLCANWSDSLIFSKASFRVLHHHHPPKCWQNSAKLKKNKITERL